VKIQQSRIIAIVSYVWIFMDILFYSFSDALLDEMKKEASNVPEDKIEEEVKDAKVALAVMLVLAIIFDFVMRFLVIDSLYHRFKEEAKPRINA
jgi:hypothetical protein